jgi:hypothetical protein
MKRGFLELLDPSNDPEFFGSLYWDHPVYLERHIKYYRGQNTLIVNVT